MSEFKREIRYHVIKLKTGNPVDCVVVEADWPEYEIVWQMIRDRVEGKPNALATAHAKGQESMALSLRLAREEGLREALAECRSLNTQSPLSGADGFECAAAIERLLIKSPAS